GPPGVPEPVGGARPLLPRPGRPPGRGAAPGRVRGDRGRAGRAGGAPAGPGRARAPAPRRRELGPGAGARPRAPGRDGAGERLMAPPRLAIAIPQTWPAGGAVDRARIRRVLARAEALGFESAWVVDHLFGALPSLDPVECLAWAAAVTERIR